MGINSCTRLNEDRLLFNALREVPAEIGFYINVGAGDPEKGSVTKLFYEKGWRGINIEPSAGWFCRLGETRNRDINIQAFASSAAGEVMLREIGSEQPGNMVDGLANSHSERDNPLRSSVVDVVTLARICEEHAPREIHFLKFRLRGVRPRCWTGWISRGSGHGSWSSRRRSQASLRSLTTAGKRHCGMRGMISCSRTGALVTTWPMSGQH